MDLSPSREQIRGDLVDSGVVGDLQDFSSRFVDGRCGLLAVSVWQATAVFVQGICRVWVSTDGVFTSVQASLDAHGLHLLEDGAGGRPQFARAEDVRDYHLACAALARHGEPPRLAGPVGDPGALTLTAREVYERVGDGELLSLAHHGVVHGINVWRGRAAAAAGNMGVWVCVEPEFSAVAESWNPRVVDTQVPTAEHAALLHLGRALRKSAARAS